MCIILVWCLNAVIIHWAYESHKYLQCCEMSLGLGFLGNRKDNAYSDFMQLQNAVCNIRYNVHIKTAVTK